MKRLSKLVVNFAFRPFSQLVLVPSSYITVQPMIRKQKVKKTGDTKVTFVISADHEHAGNVSVVGDFNEWDPGALKLKKRSNNTYSASVNLPSGQRFAFRYRTPDEVWFNDEAADAYEMGSEGQDDSIILT